MSPNRRGRHLALAAITWLVLGAAWIAPGQLVSPVAAASGLATFGKPTADSSFTAGVTFSQPVTINQDVVRVEFLLTVANAPGPTVVEVPAPDGTGARTLTHLVDPSVAGHLTPNTPLSARWRLTSAGDPTVVELGPEVRITYVDDRFKWRTETGGLVSVHWYEGNDAFGSRALKIAEDGVRQAADLLQVTETDPVDFFVYADQQAFYDALGPGNPRERRRPGERRDPNAVRAHRDRRDRPAMGRHRHSARADPPRVRYGRQQPLSLPAALAQRGARGRPEPGVRLVRSWGGGGSGAFRHPDSARRPRRPVPHELRSVQRWPIRRAFRPSTT